MDWYLVYLGICVVGGVGIVFIEVIVVVLEGRIFYVDLGIWKDEYIEGFECIICFLKE